MLTGKLRITGAGIETRGRGVPASDDDAEGRSALLSRLAFGDGKQLAANAAAAELGEGREHVDVPRARRLCLEAHQRPYDIRRLGETALEIVRIVEPIAD